MLITAAFAAITILLVVTYRIDDSDLWQHLLVGKAIWALHAIPMTHQWSWPTYGEREVLPSWGFRALLWPFWSLAHLGGLYAWRWLTTLTAFAILWATARRMGARGLSAPFVMVVAALTYRLRSQVRPETLVAVLVALQIWALESRRHAARDRSAWAIAIAWGWANIHISYYVGLLLTGIHLVDAIIERWRGGGAGGVAEVTPAAAGASEGATVRAHLNARATATRAAGPSDASGDSDARAPRRGLALPRDHALRLAAILALSAAASFVNPFGWRALAQPFEYFLVERHEPMFRIISELGPVDWSLNRLNGLAVVAIGWPLLLIARARRRGPDLVELLMCAFFSALAFSSQRFIGFYALMAAPYAARDLDDWVRARSWPLWTRAARVRAALASATCVAVVLPELVLDDPPNGVGVLSKSSPVSACDFMVARGIGGRGFNQLRSGAYLLWRFWPEKDRLPFIDTHAAGTRETRRLYVEALVREPGWRELDRRYGFEWALLSRPPPPGDRMLDFLDADSSWALVFVDDAAALYLSRRGRFGALADRFAYRELGGGETRLERLVAACATDPARRAAAREELGRQIAASQTTALSHSLLANLALVEQRYDEARAELERALAIDRDTPRAYMRLATIALATGKPNAAIEALERERRQWGVEPGLDLRMGVAYEQLGDPEKARAAWRRELRRDPSNRQAIELLQGLEGKTPR